MAIHHFQKCNLIVVNQQRMRASISYLIYTNNIYKLRIENLFEYPLILWNIIQIQLYRLCNVNHYYAFYLRTYNINKFLQFLYLVNSYYITDDPIRGLPSTGWNIFTDDFFWSRAVIHYPCCCCYFLPIRNSKNKLIVVSFL